MTKPKLSRRPAGQSLHATRNSDAESAAPPQAKDSAPVQSIELHISWKTICKVLLAILLAAGAVQLWRLLADLFLALLIGITLRPLVLWTRKRHWPEWSAALCATLILLGSAALFVGFLVPTITRQGAVLIESLPSFKSDLLRQLRPQGAMHYFAEQVLASWSSSDAKPMLEKVMSFSGIALKGLVEFLIIMVTAIYFLVDGERVYRWFLAFLPPRQRRKVGLAAGEIAEVISAYMGGQLITSLLCSAFVFTVLMLFGVPNAALLAVLAGVFDILPLIGFFLSVVPAVAAAFLVSPSTALMVGLLYLAYHLFENYFIVPKVYGKKLRLSSLTVLVFCMVAAVVGGVLGVIMILPIVASYPIIERIWLQRHLEPDTVAKHDAIEGEEAT